MKKLLNKLRRNKQNETPSRITNDTIAEHREKILAGGRRFKYPIQYAKHKLVINAIIVAVSALILTALVIWWQLYIALSSNDLVYRITRVVPLPVASVDGAPVPYSNYLLKYRSSIHFLVKKERVNLKSDDGQRQADHIKQVSIQSAIEDAYAAKTAREMGIVVEESELEAFILQKLESGKVSEATNNATILDWYGWEPDEYRYVVRNLLLRQKVSYAVDEKATKTVEALESELKTTTDLKAIAKKLNDNPETMITYDVSGPLPSDNDDWGITATAASLKVGAVSAIFTPSNGDGYYVVKLISSSGEQVNYEYIHVGLTVFEKQLDALKDSDNVSIYISIPSKEDAS